MNPPYPKPRRRPHISLLSLLLLTALVATTMVVFLQWRKLGPLEAEVRRLRSEMGYLYVAPDERDKVHAIAIGSDERREWKFRIYLPESPKYKLYSRDGVFDPRQPNQSQEEYWDMIAEQGSGGTSSLQPGESLLTVALRKDDDGRWVLAKSTLRIDENSSSRSGGRFSLNFDSLDDERLWSGSSSSIGNSQSTFEPGRPFRVLSLSEGVVTEQPGGGWSVTYDDDQPHAGIELWIEPVQ